MKNITLSINEELLREGRHYAREHHTTLNNLVRELLNSTVHKTSSTWLSEAFNLADTSSGNSHGQKWKREDLYAR